MPVYNIIIFFIFRKVSDLTYEDLALLCDLFYLPFEHGSQGLQLLQEFNWLKSNAHLVIAANQKGDKANPEVRVLLLLVFQIMNYNF